MPQPRIQEISKYDFFSPSGSHLSNQDYDICFRRGADMCVICYSPTTGGQAGGTPGSFGLR